MTQEEMAELLHERMTHDEIMKLIGEGKTLEEILKMTSEGKPKETRKETEKRIDEEHKYGPVNLQFVCPHCQQKGQVHTKQVKQKKGVSGGKATAALLTAGTSLLFAGLSRKELVTQAYCINCSSTWTF